MYNKYHYYTKIKIMKSSKFDRNTFFDTLIQGSIRTISKGPVALDRLYSGYRTLIENQIKSTPEREEECRALLQILEKAYRMFSDPEVENIILQNNISAKQFISKYGEIILGDNKRKYDMSDRFNPSLIAYTDRRKQAKKIQYIRQSGKEHIYLDAEGNEVSIQEIGRLHFEAWNGLGNSVSKYRIMKQIGPDVYQENEVFSNIRIIMMEDPEYREAVLEDLLSKNNIQLSKTGGYVGEITDISKGEKLRVGDEEVIAGDYFYRVSPKYALTYHSEDVSAAMILESAQRQRNRAKSENGKIIKITDRKKIAQKGKSPDTPTINERRAGGDSR